MDIKPELISSVGRHSLCCSEDGNEPPQKKKCNRHLVPTSSEIREAGRHLMIPFGLLCISFEVDMPGYSVAAHRWTSLSASTARATSRGWCGSVMLVRLFAVNEWQRPSYVSGPSCRLPRACPGSHIDSKKRELANTLFQSLRSRGTDNLMVTNRVHTG